MLINRQLIGNAAESPIFPQRGPLMPIKVAPCDFDFLSPPLGNSPATMGGALVSPFQRYVPLIPPPAPRQLMGDRLAASSLARITARNVTPS
jgi:hypothetical protein